MLKQLLVTAALWAIVIALFSSEIGVVFAAWVM